MRVCLTKVDFFRFNQLCHTPLTLAKSRAQPPRFKICRRLLVGRRGRGEGGGPGHFGDD